jgi:hypothetical protein
LPPFLWNITGSMINMNIISYNTLVNLLCSNIWRVWSKTDL